MTLPILDCPDRVPHPLGHACGLAASVWGRPIPVHPSACRHCLTGPRGAKAVEAAIAGQMRGLGRSVLELDPAAERIAQRVPGPERREPIAKPTRWAVAVLTAPRPGGVTYLPETLASLEAAGWTEYTVYAEPGAIVPEHVKSVVRHPAQKGIFGNHYGALSDSIHSRGRGAPHAVLVIEDDVRFARGLRQWAERWLLWPAGPPSIVSLFANSQTARGKRPGVHHYEGLWGQAVIWHPDAIRGYLGDPEVIAHEFADDQSREACADWKTHQHFLRHGGRPWVVVGPAESSLVSHRPGVISSLWPEERKKQVAAWRAESLWYEDWSPADAPVRPPVLSGEERLKICGECRFWNASGNDERQGVCGFRDPSCGCSGRVRSGNIGDPSISCPLGKWVGDA